MTSCYTAAVKTEVKMTTYFSSVGLRPGTPEALLDD